MYYSKKMIEHNIKQWLAEDLGSGDITTQNIVPQGAITTAVIHAKQDGILAGNEIAQYVFQYLNPQIKYVECKKDGETLEFGDVIAKIEGDAQTILSGERLALNLLQRLSGIATKTKEFADCIKGYSAKIADTRKTTPGLRLLEKYAVTVGGGCNHRFGLYDAVMIKDNHIKVAGGILEAINKVRQSIPHTVKIEVEVESLEQVELALIGKADIIMLDNMSTELMLQAVEMIKGQALVEASGGVNLLTIENIAKTGVDIISVGAITHSVMALDISLDIGEIKVNK